MSRLIFRLRGVPEDEAEEVRALLVENEIDFFETGAGNWGISMPGLWIRNDEEFDRARDLLDTYQRQRALRVREEYQLGRERGEKRSLWHSLREDPIRFLMYTILIGVVLYLSLYYFFSF